MQEYKKILVIKLGSLGDWIQMTGAYAAIRHCWPEAHITLQTGKSFMNMAKQSHYFDDYIEDNRTWNPLDYLRIARTITAGGFDLIVDLQMQKRTKKRYYTLARLWTKTGFCWAYPKNGQLLQRHVFAKPRLLWGKDEEENIDFPLEQANLSFCKANPEVLAALPARYVLMIPGCSPTHPYKRWPADSYRALALRLAEQDIPCVVLGTSAEKNEIDLICRDNPKAVNFCNKSALLDIPQIAEKSLAVVGNDTGPQHMAELVDVPVVTLFCAITQKSAVCRPNVVNIWEQNIADISVDSVFQALQSLWHKA